MNGTDNHPQTYTQLSVLLRLLRLVAPFWRWMLAAILLGVLTIGSSVALMAASAFIIAKAALRPSIADLGLAIVGVRLFGITRGLFRYLERLVSHETTFRLLARLRVWFYSALEPLAPAHLTRFRSGDLLARIMSDIETLEHFYLRVIAPPLVATTVVAGVALFMGTIDPTVGLVALAFLILAGVVMPVVTHLLARRVGQRSVETRAELDVLSLDGIQGASELLAFGQADAHFEKLQTVNAQIAREQRHMARVTALDGAFHLLLIGAAVFAVLLVSIPLVEGGQMDGVYLTVVALVMMASFESVQAMPTALQFLSESIAAGKRLFEIADAKPVVAGAEPLHSGPVHAGGIHFENVRFRYNTDDAVALNDISFTVNPGEQVAVVGPSGAGKSTLVNLLLRFWDVEGGMIAVDGRDVRTMSQVELRGLFGVVTQNTYLFNTSVRENILIGRRDASEEEMIEAAKAAQIHEFVMSLPEGYDTYVGEQGLQFSGGERQRIAIARALLKDAPFLLLDEATANLDSVTEQDVQAAIRHLMVGRTTLIITHHISGLELVDRVLVLRDGYVVEQGTHAELIEPDSFYRRLWMSRHQRIGAA